MAFPKDRFNIRHPLQLVPLTGCAVVALALQAAPAAADGGWTVVQGSGSATHRVADGRTMPLRTGDIVAEGDAVAAGADARFVLKHHDHADTMTVNPGSQFRIPDPRREANAATVVESAGTLQFDVEHTPGRRFEVDGPYLAAVVKGTSFSVAVGAGGSTVNVTQGAVEVQSRDTHRTALVGPGQFAMVSGFGKHELSVGGKPAAVGPVPGAGAAKPAAANTAPAAQGLTTAIGETHLDVGALTNNLVSNAGGPPVGATISPAAKTFGAGSAPAAPGATPPAVAAVTQGGASAVAAAVAAGNAVTQQANINAGGNGNGLALGLGDNGNGLALGPGNAGGNGNGPGGNDNGPGGKGKGPGGKALADGGPKGPGADGPGGKGPGGDDGGGKGPGGKGPGGNGPDGNGPPGLLKKLLGGKH